MHLFIELYAYLERRGLVKCPSESMALPAQMLTNFFILAETRPCTLLSRLAGSYIVYPTSHGEYPPTWVTHGRQLVLS